MIPPNAPSIPDWMRTVASALNPFLSLYRSDNSQKQPRIVIQDSDFPAFSGSEPNTGLSVYTRNNAENGAGKAGVYSFMVSGTGNMVPFSTVGGTDCVALSGAVYSGGDAPNSVCVGNIVTRFAGAPPGINWGLEIDVNNETTSTYTTGDPRYGQGLVLNTGSTYSPDTGIVITRAAGEGTGPGWKQGISITGVRDTALIVQAMSTTSAPGISPAATGTVTALAVGVGGESQYRFRMTESGAMNWGSGSAVTDVSLSRSGVGALSCSGAFGATQYFVAANYVVGARRTGWATATGTATRTTFDTATVTLSQLAERVKALIDDIHATAGHGLIGT